jgi:hypothetical protein
LRFFEKRLIIPSVSRRGPETLTTATIDAREIKHKMTAAFKVTTINVGTNSPELVLLSGREYKKPYTALPNANLPRDMRNQLGVVFNYLSGEEFSMEENTFLIKADNGAYSRLFGPVLKAGNSEVEGTSPDSLYIQWGNRFIPLNATKGKFTRYDGSEVEAEFGAFNFSGRGEDSALFVSVDDPSGDGQVVLPIAVRFNDWNNHPDAKSMGVMLKKAPEEIAKIVQQVAPKGGGGRLEATNECEFKDLELDTPYSVVSYYPCKTRYGVTYKILIQDHPNAGEVCSVWAHSSIKPLLATKPEITQERPATLTLRSKEQKDDGKWYIRAVLLLSAVEDAPEDGVDLNFD